MKISYRLTNSIMLTLCVASLLFAYILQYGLQLLPCNLCVLQRAMVYTVTLFTLLAVIHNPEGHIRFVYSGFNLLFAGIGLALSTRQVYLQRLPEDLKPSCGPGLDFLLQDMPFWEAIRTAVVGSGDCASIQWTFLGLSLPFWTGVLFAILIFGNLITLGLKE